MSFGFVQNLSRSLMFGVVYGDARMPNWPHWHRTPFSGIATTGLHRDLSRSYDFFILQSITISLQMRSFFFLNTPLPKGLAALLPIWLLEADENFVTDGISTCDTALWFIFPDKPVSLFSYVFFGGALRNVLQHFSIHVLHNYIFRCNNKKTYFRWYMWSAKKEIVVYSRSFFFSHLDPLPVGQRCSEGIFWGYTLPS